MDKKKEFDKQYLRMAFIWANNSYAVRRKVGCLIVKNNSIIADGYNGTPSGFPNRCEYLKEYGEDYTISDEEMETIKQSPEKISKLITYDYVLHAESNAIAKLSKASLSSDGATIYVTDEPCIHCAKMIIQAGIERVVYSRLYHNHDGINLLKRGGIIVENIPMSDLIQ